MAECRWRLHTRFTGGALVGTMAICKDSFKKGEWKMFKKHHKRGSFWCLVVMLLLMVAHSALLALPTSASESITPMVAAGYTHSLGLKSDGTVWAWGSNSFGQLGDGTYVNGVNKTTPAQVSGLNGVIDVAGGTYFTIALKSDGTVWMCGGNDYGQLGDGTTTWKFTPVQVSGLNSVIDIAGGGHHTIVLKSDGTV